MCYVKRRHKMALEYVKTLVTLLVVGSVLCSERATIASRCQLQQPSWRCTDDPKLTIIFEQVTLESCGGLYDKEMLKTMLAVTYRQADPLKTYTLVMADPDAPGHTDGQAYLHLLRAGISGKDLLSGDQLTGTNVVEYARPTPPKGTGVHRYVIYLYEEFPPEDPEFVPFPGSFKERSHFDLHSYAQSYDLCGPVAHNMFLAEFAARI